MDEVIKNPIGLSIGGALIEGVQRLSESAVAEPRREAGSLLAHVLNCDRSFVIAHADEELNKEEAGAFRSLIARRGAGEPLQYVSVHQEFSNPAFECRRPGV